MMVERMFGYQHGDVVSLVDESADEVQDRRVGRMDEVAAGDQHVLAVRKGIGKAFVDLPHDLW